MIASMLTAVLLSAGPRPSAISASAERPSQDRAGPATAGQNVLYLERDAGRRAQQLRDLATQRLRREATTEGPQNEQAIRDLIQLFLALDADTSLNSHVRSRLQGLIRGRLLRASARIEAQIARRRTASVADPDQSAAMLPGMDLPLVLRQLLDHVGRGLARISADPRSGEQLLALIKRTILPVPREDADARAIAVSLSRLGPMIRSGRDLMERLPARISGALGGAAANDEGEQLVELIQTVIAPNSWDVNGGPGSIYYWSHLRVLVIRQTSETHDDIGGVLGQLRQAGN